MTPIDFQGISALDPSIVDLISQHLDERENELAHSIIDAVPHHQQEPALSYSYTSKLKLADALEVFGKSCSQNSHSQYIKDEWKHPVEKINRALWKYTETLEESSTGLFRQLDMLELDQWHGNLAQVVQNTKDLLLHKIEELTWAIKRIEDLLWRYRLQVESHTKSSTIFSKVAHATGSSLLDKSLVPDLQKTQSFVRTQYKKFLERHRAYQQLLDGISPSIDRLYEYPVFQSFDKEVKQHFAKTFELFQLWESNRTAKAIPEKDLTLAIRHTHSIEKIYSLLREYHLNIKHFLVHESHLLKQHGPELPFDAEPKEDIERELEAELSEIQMLKTTVFNYRNFLLKTDPDPYVRSQKGFSEWVSGPEPAQTKALLNLGYDIDYSHQLCTRLKKALEVDPSAAQPPSIGDVDPVIQEALHSMTQPLISKDRVRAQAERILHQLNQLDEWASFSYDTVDYTGSIFAQLLKLDWKYHVLFEFPLFHQLFGVHHGLMKPMDDRAHSNRLSKLRKLLHQIQEWVVKHRTQTHFHDIELDSNDIKVYLQDFLAYIQRVVSDKNLTADRAKELKLDFEQQLLEYRFLFGSFFHNLSQHDVDGQIIRRRFLFVDHYFQSIEQQLIDLGNKDFTPPKAEEIESSDADSDDAGESEES